MSNRKYGNSVIISIAIYQNFYIIKFMQTLKRLFVAIAKAITIFFTILSLILVVISLAKPDWIKFGISWI